MSDEIGVEDEKRLVTRIEPFGALVYDRWSTLMFELTQEETKRTLGYNGAFPSDLTAPRFVHIEASNRCTFNCAYCYVPSRNVGSEMTSEQLCTIQEQLAAMKVFSVTYGGGEPFMRRDLFDLAKHAREIGLDVAVTTNGLLLGDDPRLRAFRQINVSLHEDMSLMKKAAMIAAKHTMVGVNVIMTKQFLPHLDDVASFCRDNNFELLLLSYKPVRGDTEQAISPAEIRRRAVDLTRRGVRVAADALSCGLNVDADWFLNIGTTGDVYQCSFNRTSIGNVLSTHFASIWQNRPREHACPLHSPRRE